MPIDRSTALCLACSASLPPRTTRPSFTTECCSKPICEGCLEQNPRLRRYNPCLACLGGVNAVSSSSRTIRNVDGGVTDADVFILDDEEEDDPEGATDDSTVAGRQKATVTGTDKQATPKEAGHTQPGSGKYFINRLDTLQGIAFKLGVDARLMCRLNNLPTSTLSTTPHLLHTREYLLVPGNHISQQCVDDDVLIHTHGTQGTH
ncbi:hypothetical protein BDN72DRAFT_762459 [Pluteus cervinus]|uniref:Uncharacterized protein n=1 Tax=Pluteus cervinus TaxID=181527 RepID=A0ACD3B4X7_9AGAR|nr:hypothetical protein BDN72DRAFT_762459 [Pluteus cervinus]